MRISTMGVVALLVVASQCLLLGMAAVDTTELDRYSSGRPEERRLATLQWCIAKPNLEDTYYQGALDWACGPLSGQGQVNCGPIQQGQSCYLPDTYQSHASWAFNAYYQTHGQTSQSCDFQGTAVITTTDPSTSTCPYTGSNGTTSTSFNGTNGATGNHMIHSKALSYLSIVVSVIVYFRTGQAF